MIEEQTKSFVLEKDVLYHLDPSNVSIDDVYARLKDIAKDSNASDIYEDVSFIDYFSLVCLFDDFIIKISFMRNEDYRYTVAVVPCYKSELTEDKEFCGHKISVPPAWYILKIKDKTREINDKIQSKLGHLINVKVSD